MDNAALLDELMGVNRNHDKADAVITVQSTLHAVNVVLILSHGPDSLCMLPTQHTYTNNNNNRVAMILVCAATSCVDAALRCCSATPRRTWVTAEVSTMRR